MQNVAVDQLNTSNFITFVGRCLAFALTDVATVNVCKRKSHVIHCFHSQCHSRFEIGSDQGFNFSKRSFMHPSEKTNTLKLRHVVF